MQSTYVSIIVRRADTHLVGMECPRSIDFIDAMPRLPTGKLYKKPLREKYSAGRTTRIV